VIDGHLDREPVTRRHAEDLLPPFAREIAKVRIVVSSSAQRLHRRADERAPYERRAPDALARTVEREYRLLAHRSSDSVPQQAAEPRRRGSLPAQRHERARRFHEKIGEWPSKCAPSA